MAYGKRKSRKTAARKGYSRSRRAGGYSSRGNRGSARGRRSGGSRSGRSTVTIRVVQEAPQALSPVAAQMLAEGKVTLPRKARF